MKSENSWKLLYTSQNEARFEVAAKLDWPAPFKFGLRNLRVVIARDGRDGKHATVPLMAVVPVAKDLMLGANTTGASVPVHLSLLASDLGATFCSSGRAYADIRKCALGDMLQRAVSQIESTVRRGGPKHTRVRICVCMAPLDV